VDAVIELTCRRVPLGGDTQAGGISTSVCRLLWKVMISLTPRATQAEVFFDIPRRLIVVAGQIRSRIDEEGAVFRKEVRTG
jgi:hypothetical protein